VTMLVASDHGFTTLEYEVHLNEWLRQEGWLDYEDDGHDELGDISDDTRAYSLIPGRFYINLEGREPNGSVPQEEYEEVRAELRESLEQLEGPDGNPVADRIETKESAFRGDHDDIAPDLTVVPNHGFDLKAGFKGSQEVFDTGPRNGMHSFDNACLLVDEPDVRIEDADLYDITPTILDLLDLDVARTEFDGSSLVAN
jgi:predicted AlkP superfamily phosphohydrolase/phosphomutase